MTIREFNNLIGTGVRLYIKDNMDGIPIEDYYENEINLGWNSIMCKYVLYNGKTIETTFSIDNCYLDYGALILPKDDIDGASSWQLDITTVGVLDESVEEYNLRQLGDTSSSEQ